MRNELEASFGRTLRLLATHLIKNAEPVPSATLQGARAFEEFTWDKLGGGEQKELLGRIVAETGPGSSVERHFEHYPHPFSKNRYAEYVLTLRSYQDSLQA
ncbi:MAG: hypothetical protein LBN38_04375 [Verrucomicrobiota bacterium]|jgi:hypothetical protein|nr:hypothetical protein [Verrucomicrobiota bacterium]